MNKGVPVVWVGWRAQRTAGAGAGGKMVCVSRDDLVFVGVGVPELVASEGMAGMAA